MLFNDSTIQRAIYGMAGTSFAQVGGRGMGRVLAAILSLLLLAPGLARAADGSPYQRSSRKVLSAFREIVAKPSKATVVVISDGKPAALGAIVDAHGFILTKASELKSSIECELRDGRRLPASLVGVHRDTDLAMLRVEAADLPVLEWRTTAAPAVGSWLATPGASDDPTAIGVVSVLPRKAPAPNGVLGIVLAEDPLGPRIEQVLAESAAEKAGLLVNDLVLKVNGKETKDRRTLIETVRGYQPGERVDLLIRRGEEDVNVAATLSDRFSEEPANRNDFQNSLGGELSSRRAGFASVLQHDTVLSPSQCGGPLVDSEGKAVGINIARAGRVASFAIPADLIVPLIEDLKSGKLAPVIVSQPSGDSPSKAGAVGTEAPAETMAPGAPTP